MKTLRLDYYFLCLIFLCIAFITGCQKSSSPSNTVLLDEQKFTIINHDGSKAELTLELARTQPEQRRGLMFRTSLLPNHGMIFIFPQEKKNAFWMKNTYIPLDMLFLNKDKIVVGILPEVPPLNEENRSVDGLSQYVVELGEKEAARLHIEVGSKLEGEGI